MSSTPSQPVHEEESVPAPVTSSQHNEGILVKKSNSGVNGTGQWKTWRGAFKSPEFAMLDLFDNCVDATLHDEFVGRIDVFRDEFEPAHSICMRNNCAGPIPDLEHVLEVYGQAKSDEQDQIGQNGVGVKQACAALSDLSFVVTKNEKVLSVGVINKSLQTNGVCLPSYEFGQSTLNFGLDMVLFEDADFCDSLSRFGGGDTTRGRKRLTKHLDALSRCEDDHVFLVILDRIRQGDEDGGVDALFASLTEKLPKHYLHVPPSFMVSIDMVRLEFQYWERRLAEIHWFPLLVDPVNSYEVAEDWHEPLRHHMVSIYIGFDPLRAVIPNKNNVSLFVYSRKSGRLVEQVEDARGLFSLGNGSNAYAQGLTVIVDDFGSNLPLSPQKQGIHFGDETHGKIHEQNLFAWAGAFAHCYWEHFLFKLRTKAALRKEVVSHTPAVEKMLSNRFYPVPATLQQPKLFSTFELMWFDFNKKSHNRIRCGNRIGNKDREEPYKSVPGEGTGIKFRTMVARAANATSSTKSNGRNARKKRAKPEAETVAIVAIKRRPSKRKAQAVAAYWCESASDAESVMEEQNEQDALVEEQNKQLGDADYKKEESDTDLDEHIDEPVRQRRKNVMEAATQATKQQEYLKRINQELRETLKATQIQAAAAVKTVGSLRTVVKELRRQQKTVITPKREDDAAASNADELKILQAKYETQDEKMVEYESEIDKLRRRLQAHRDVIKDLQQTNGSLQMLADV